MTPYSVARGIPLDRTISTEFPASQLQVLKVKKLQVHSQKPGVRPVQVKYPDPKEDQIGQAGWG